MAIGDDRQNEDGPRKPGLFGRLFGRGREEAKPTPSAPAEPTAPVPPAEAPALPELTIDSVPEAAPEPAPTPTAILQP